MIGVVIASLAGCAIVPKTTTTTKTLGYTEREVPGPIRGLEVRVSADASSVRVESVHARRCQRRVTETIETRKALQAVLDTSGGDGGGDPRALIGLAVAEPAILLVTGVITGIVIGASHDDVQEHTVEHVVADYDCSLRAAHVPIEMVLPSGARLAATTDDAGKSTIEIPADEPPRGKVVLLSGSARAVLTYAATPLATTPAVAFSPPGMTGAGSAAEVDTSVQHEDQAPDSAQAYSKVAHALRACAGVEKGVAGVVHARLAIDRDGRVRASIDRDDSDFTACVNELLSTVRFPAGRAQTVMFPYKL